MGACPIHNDFFIIFASLQFLCNTDFIVLTGVKLLSLNNLPLCKSDKWINPNIISTIINQQYKCQFLSSLLNKKIYN